MRLGNRSMDEWIAEYAHSHQHPFNRFCHTLGIPIITLSIILLLGSLAVHGLWPWGLGLFVAGWMFQFLGHFVEGKPPEFLKDWRFLLVGLRWWVAKLKGRA
ncbi:MAG TPA: Mpo1-like protein [Gemmatimonadales bacterium]|jgi:uncharacterized membrane protein YGL010W